MPVNPYTAKLLEITAAMQAQKNAPPVPMFSEEELRRRKAKQQREEQLAILAKMSGDKDMAAVGSAMLPGALKARAPQITEHGVYNPVDSKLRVFPEYEQRMKMGSLEKERGRLDLKESDYLALEQRKEAAALQRKQERDIENERKVAAAKLLADAKKAEADRKAALKSAETGKGKVLTGQIYKDLKKVGDDIDDIASIRKSFKEKFTGDTSYGISQIGDIQDYAAAQVPAFVPDSWVKNRRAWADLQRIKEMKERHEKFGATLTPNEQNAWNQVTPPRGADAKQLEEWISAQEALILRAASFAGEAAAAGGWNKEQIGVMTRGVWKVPKTESPEEEIKRLEAELYGPK